MVEAPTIDGILLQQCGKHYAILLVVNVNSRLGSMTSPVPQQLINKVLIKPVCNSNSNKTYAKIPSVIGSRG